MEFKIVILFQNEHFKGVYIYIIYTNILKRNVRLRKNLTHQYQIIKKDDETNLNGYCSSLFIAQLKTKHKYVQSD